jgi:predicted double-glycine peptidase
MNCRNPRPNKKRRIFALLRLTGMSGLIAAYLLIPLSFPFLKKHCCIYKQARAWKKGAHFVTDEGVVLQSGSNDCGPASLKMILDVHGIERSISDLASDLRLTPVGTSMLDLRLVSIKLGLPAKSWSVQPGDLSRVPLPAIAFVNKNHFVVIRRFVSPELLLVDDPALGRLRWPARAFEKAWSGRMLIFDPDWTPL